MVEWSTFLSACAQGLIFTLVVCACVLAVRATFEKEPGTLLTTIKAKVAAARTRKDSGEAPQARVIAPTEKIPVAK